MKTVIKTPRLLAIETSAEYCSVALMVGDQIELAHRHAGQKHSDLLLPMIDELVKASGVRVRDFEAIAFGAGPGAFTGLRIGCGVVQGLAFAADCPVVPVGSLVALAEATAGARVVVCTDARMKQIYHGAFERQGELWVEIASPSLCDPDQAPPLPGDGWLGCGSGFSRYRDELARTYAKQLERIDTQAVASAAQVAVLGAQYLSAGSALSCSDALPIYVRDKVALTLKEQG